MKKLRLRKNAFTLKSALVYLCLTAAMTLLNFALPYREPLAFALLFAALSLGLNCYLLGAGYLISALPTLNLYALLSALAQALFCILIFALYRRYQKRMSLERVV